MISKIKQNYFLLKDYTTIVFGLFLYAFGWTAFFLPSEITTGGVTGIGALVYYATGTIPMSVTYAAINLVLLAISIRILGWQFSIKTIFGVIVMTLLLSIMQPLFKGVVFLEGEPFMSAVLGGLFCGAGIGIVFTANGSTGGTDIIAAVINKYRNITIGRAILYCDVLIISSSYLIFGSISKVVYGLTVMVIISYTVDMVINGDRQSVQFFIFSKKFAEIATEINNIPRGVTVVDGMGWYTKQPTKILVVMAKKSESVKIFRLVKNIDPEAFVSQSAAIGVYGAGFDVIKTK